MTDAQTEIMRRLIANVKIGYSFDQEFYVSDAVFKADMEHVISRKWLVAGHVSRIPNKGDYFLFKVGAEQIIVIRENEDSVRAYFNVCRHRGSTLCSAESGNAPRLVCPYHAWTFGLDGSLISARLMPEDFNKAENSLFACHVRVFHGLIFVNMSEDEPDDFDATLRIFLNVLTAVPRTLSFAQCTPQRRWWQWAQAPGLALRKQLPISRLS